MSASWEKGLEGITNGSVDFWEYRQKLEAFIRRETERMIAQDLKEPLTDKISEFAGKNGKGAGARRKIGVKCPICEGEIVTTPFGYGCSNYKTDKSGCNFTIGEIAGKILEEEQVKKLLTEGYTDTIRDFKSKNKKRFDAVLKLEKTEDGKNKIVFDFDSVEPDILSEVVCPICGGQIVKKSFGYGCMNYDVTNEHSCRFAIGTIAGKKLGPTAVKQLLKNGVTSTIRGFKSKTGKRFEASLKLTEDKKIVFDFQERPKPVQSQLSCPKCQNLMLKTQWQYECNCGFKVWHTVAKVALSEETMAELFTNGKTQHKIQGFTSKAGNVFDAYLKYEEDTIKFDFERS